MKHFFFSKLDSRRCFRCLNSINFNKAETKLTSAGHHNTQRCRSAPAASRHARRALSATARRLPASWKVKAIQTLAFFHGWLVNWGTTPSNARAYRRQTPRASVVPVVSVLWYGSSSRTRSPGKKLALQLFFGEWENQQLWIVSHVMLPESNDCMLISFSATSSTTSSTISCYVLLCVVHAYLYYSQSLRQKRWASFFQGP